MTFRSAARAAIHLLVTYATALPRIIYRSTLSLVIHPKGYQTFMHQVLNAIDLESDDPVLTSADIEDLTVGDGGMFRL
jgi:hypothetical protein